MKAALLLAAAVMPRAMTGPEYHALLRKFEEAADHREPVRVVITLPADFPARIRRVAPELSVQAFVRAATEAELTGLEGTLHTGANP